MSLGKPWKIWENMGNSWEIYGKIMGKSWEDIGTSGVSKLKS
jgi:hypothetical protein